MKKPVSNFELNLPSSIRCRHRRRSAPRPACYPSSIYTRTPRSGESPARQFPARSRISRPSGRWSRNSPAPGRPAACRAIYRALLPELQTKHLNVWYLSLFERDFIWEWYNFPVLDTVENQPHYSLSENEKITYEKICCNNISASWSVSFRKISLLLAWYFHWKRMIFF